MGNCFVIMPFRPELHYMYLYMKQHIEATFPGVQCKRGDDAILTETVLEKIAGYIRQADVLIADCTGRNPNVFYELGMAHALERPVILITGDDVTEAPTDIRAFEFIHYRLESDVEFFEKLDRALGQRLRSQFDELYDRAEALFQEFRAAKHVAAAMVSRQEFTRAAALKVRTSGTPALGDLKTIATLFLPIIMAGPADLDVMLKVKEWIEAKFGA
jgi:nucleoside 2-deoxyribosyltransferase